MGLEEQKEVQSMMALFSGDFLYSQETGMVFRDRSKNLLRFVNKSTRENKPPGTGGCTPRVPIQ
jgi:hypothetical protein